MKIAGCNLNGNGENYFVISHRIFTEVSVRKNITNRPRIDAKGYNTAEWNHNYLHTFNEIIKQLLYLVGLTWVGR